MLCPNCGTKFHPGDSFCYGCGVSLPELTASQGESGPSQPSMPPSPESGLHSYAAAAPALAPDPPQQIAPPQPQQSVPPPQQQVAPEPPQQSAPPPPLVLGYAPPPIVADAVPQLAPVRYAGFMVLTLTVILCASIALLLTVQGIFMHAQKEIYLKAGPLLLVVVVLAKVLADQAGQIKAHPEPKGFTKLLKAALCVALMFLTVAGLVGWHMGARRFAFDRMIADWRHISQVGQDISDQRNAVAGQNISAHVQMYKAIEKDVLDMDATTQRLMDEERTFVERYPDYSAQSDKEVADLDIVRRRAVLLQQQIQVAGRMSTQSNEQQIVMWVKEMVPLLQQEKLLDSPGQSQSE